MMSKLDELIQELCPDGVEYKPLYDIGKIFKGMSGVSNKWGENGNCRFIDYKNVYDRLKVDVNDLPFATVKKIENQIILQKGDILFTSASETPDECAISSVIENEIIDGIFLDDHLFGIRLGSQEENIPSFFNYYFRSESFRKAVNRTVRGVTRFYISMPDFSKIMVPVPPFPVQQEIVRILDNFTELTAELKEKLTVELTARKKQYEYYMEKFLLFNENIQFDRLGNTCYMKSGKGIPSSKISCTCSNDTPYKCYGGNGIRGYVSNISHSGEYPIIGRQGALCGNINYATGDFYATEHAVVVKSKGRYIPKFLYYLLISMNLNKYKSKGAQPGLAVGNIENLVAPVPPIEEQNRIVSILDRFDSLCNDITSGLPAEIEARQKQYEYYRDKLLTFKELKK